MMLDCDDEAEATAYATMIRAEQTGQQTLKIKGPEIFMGDFAVRAALYDHPEDPELALAEAWLSPGSRWTETFYACSTAPRILALAFAASLTTMGNFTFVVAVKGDPRWELLSLVKYNLKPRLRPPTPKERGQA